MRLNLRWQILKFKIKSGCTATKSATDLQTARNNSVRPRQGPKTWSWEQIPGRSIKMQKAYQRSWHATNHITSISNVHYNRDTKQTDILLTEQPFSFVKIRVARKQRTLTSESNPTPVIPNIVFSLCVRLQQLNNIELVVVVANICLQMNTPDNIISNETD